MEEEKNNTTINTDDNNKNSGSHFFKRTKLFIKKDFQIRMILIILLTTIIFANINGVIIYSFFTRSLGADQLLTWLKIDDPIDIIFQVIFITESIGVMIIFLISIFISHRLAGPIYKIGLSLGKMANGNLSEPMKLRKNDEFREIEIEINNTIEGLKEIITDINADVDSLDMIIDDKKIKDSQLTKALKNLKDDLLRFKV